MILVRKDSSYREIKRALGKSRKGVSQNGRAKGETPVSLIGMGTAYLGT